MRVLQFLCDLRSYYRGCRDRDLHKFYDLESRLPYFDHAGFILGAHKRRLLLSWIGEKPVYEPILELGSGIGTFARQLSCKGYQVLAIDISTAKILKARRLAAKKRVGQAAPVRHIVGDLRDLGSGTALDLQIQKVCKSQPLRQFDVILAADVLEHVPDPPHETLWRIRNLLAPQGRFFTSVPSRLCINDPGHFWTLLPDEWEQVFTESNFGIQRRQMSRLCWFGLPTPLPLAMVYELQSVAVKPHQDTTAGPETAS